MTSLHSKPSHFQFLLLQCRIWRWQLGADMARKTYSELILAYVNQFQPETKFQLLANAIEHGEYFGFPAEELAPLRREGVETYELMRAAA